MILLNYNKIHEILQKIPQFENAGDLLVNHAISLSVSSERFATTGQPILILNVMGKLYSGNLHADNLFRKQNNRIINVFSSILKTTTFTPQIQHRGAEVNNNLKGKHWLTNVRVDGNGHVQISGYGLKLSYITELTEKLEDAGTCKTIRLNSLNKNTYRKIPVWRFDMTARIK